MQAVSLPSKAGWYWIRDGFSLLRRQPVALILWSMLIALMLTLGSMLVPVGLAIFIGLMPTITVLTLALCRMVEQKQAVQPATLWQQLSQSGALPALFGMGAIYIGLILLAGIVAFLPFIGSLRRELEAVNPHDTLPDLMNLMAGPMLLFGVFYLVIATLFWYAPVLRAWHGVPLRKALFFSMVACWRNKGAFIIYGLAWGGLLLLLEALTMMLLIIGLPEVMVSLLRMPAGLVLAAGLYASYYANYRTVLREDHVPEA